MAAVDVLQVTTSIKGRQLDVLRFSQSEVSIGRDAACGIVFDNPGVSRLHAVITLDGDGGVLIADRQSSNGTYVNGKRVERSALRPGDRVEIGKFTLQVTPLRGPAVAGAAAAPAGQADASSDFLASRSPSMAPPEGGTVVLGAAQRERILGELKSPPPRPAAPAPRSAGGGVAGAALFLAGAAVGALITFLLMR